MFLLTPLLLGLNACGIDSDAIEQTVKPDKPKLPNLEDFVKSVYTGDPNQITGVYVPDTYAMKIVQQPHGDPTFISSDPQEITQFGKAMDYGSIGLLAHNTLAGAQFMEMSMNQVFAIVYGNGDVAYYQIHELQQFRAIQPDDPYSDFINIGNSTEGIIESEDVYKRIYGPGNRVVFQTCIEAENNPNWGRAFIIAAPYELTNDQ